MTIFDTGFKTERNAQCFARLQKWTFATEASFSLRKAQNRFSLKATWKSNYWRNVSIKSSFHLSTDLYSTSKRCFWLFGSSICLILNQLTSFDTEIDCTFIHSWKLKCWRPFKKSRFHLSTGTSKNRCGSFQAQICLNINRSLCFINERVQIDCTFIHSWNSKYWRNISKKSSFHLSTGTSKRCFWLLGGSFCLINNQSTSFNNEIDCTFIQSWKLKCWRHLSKSPVFT